MVTMGFPGGEEVLLFWEELCLTYSVVSWPCSATDVIYSLYIYHVETQLKKREREKERGTTGQNGVTLA